MSGKIELDVRLGKSKDHRYDSYPEAFIIVTDEDNSKKKVKMSPSYRSRGRNDSLEELLTFFRVHELKVDRTRERKRYTSSLIAFLEDMVEKLSQTKLDEFEEIEEIYLKPKKKWE